MQRGLVLACCAALVGAPVSPPLVTSAAAQSATPQMEAQSATARPDDDLVGLWAGETTFGPRLRGALTLERGAKAWTARIGGLAATAALSGDGTRDTVHLVMPGGNGELRARVENGGGTVRGFWIQPAGNLQSYASPVTLRRTRAGAWRGTVVPLDDRMSLYLLVRRDSAGTLRGSFHNPERGWTGGASWYRVSREGNELVLVDPKSGKERFRQPYDAARRRITMDFGAPVTLTPRSPAEAPGFLPRPPGAPPYEYRAPGPKRDGWPTARAADVGLDETSLRDLVRYIAAVDPAAPGAPLIHSVLVARRGKLVLEEYFFGFTADRPHDTRSASKTITSVLVGVAADHGALSPSTPVYSLFGHPDSADPRKARITVGHLLTHSSGLACDDNDDASPGNEGVMQQQTRQPDWYRYILDLPVVHEPGTLYAYCSGTMNLAGGAVAAATGSWLPEYFDRHVARPLGIERYHVNLMPTGQAYSGGGMYLLPRDLLKIGQTYLDGGVWRSRRIVSKRWVETSTARQIGDSATGDGYGWHRSRLEANGRSYQEYEANGNGGQFVIVVPELELVVVFTAGNYMRYQIWGKFRNELVPKYVMAAMRR